MKDKQSFWHGSLTAWCSHVSHTTNAQGGDSRHCGYVCDYGPASVVMYDGMGTDSVLTHFTSSRGTRMQRSHT